jgi:serine protease Do
MSLYELPKIDISKIKISLPKMSESGKKTFHNALAIILVSIIFGFSAGVGGGVLAYIYAGKYLSDLNLIPVTNNNANQQSVGGYVPETSQEEAIITAVKNVSPAVVSVIVSKDMPIFEQYYYNPFGDMNPQFQIPQYRQNGTKLQEIGGGTGFIISKDGLVLTNKHVAVDKDAEYTVLTNDGKKYPAKILSIDPVQDLAVLKIEKGSILDNNGGVVSDNFPVVQFGDSDGVQSGQTVIAIGNALGEFRNTVSVGVISGLGRTITASGGQDFSETLEDIIQTDAAINAGNSGGPLLNLKGEVIGINTAMASGAQSIGFAIPINKAKKDVGQIKDIGKIVYPFLGIRYVLIDDTVKKDKNLSVDYGALVAKGSSGELAVTVGSGADKAGIKEGDIVLEFNGEKITVDNSLAKIIAKYNAGDKISLKILRDGKEMSLEITLGERSE